MIIETDLSFIEQFDRDTNCARHVVKVVEKMLVVLRSMRCGYEDCASQSVKGLSSESIYSRITVNS